MMSAVCVVLYNYCKEVRNEPASQVHTNHISSVFKTQNKHCTRHSTSTTQKLKKQHIPKNTMLHTLQSTVKQFMTSTASYLYIIRQLEHLYKVFSNEDRKCTLSKVA